MGGRGRRDGSSGRRDGSQTDSRDGTTYPEVYAPTKSGIYQLDSQWAHHSCEPPSKFAEVMIWTMSCSGTDFDVVLQFSTLCCLCFY